MSKNDTLLIAYDGDCPFCASYIKMQRLRELDMDIELINFREAPDLVEKLKSQGLNPNKGMYVELEGTPYYADEAMTVLSTLTTSNNWLNLGLKWWFKSKTRAKWLYPVLRLGREGALKVLGRKKI